MQKDGEEDLLCDFAEFYHIDPHTFNSLPPTTQAALAAGLPFSSRSLRRKSGLPQPLEIMLLARLIDEVQLLRYGLSDQKGGKPQLMTDLLEKAEKERRKAKEPPKYKGFRDRASFDAWLVSITEKEGDE